MGLNGLGVLGHVIVDFEILNPQLSSGWGLGKSKGRSCLGGAAPVMDRDS